MENDPVQWNYDRHELIADGVVHTVGVVLALIGVTALIFYASVFSSHGQLAASWIYGVGLVVALGVSFAYNLWPVSPLKWHLRRLDHSAIFVLIAATYTPFLQRGWHDPLLAAMLVGMWLMAALGIALKLLLPARFDRISIVIYLVMGWSGLLAVGPLISTLSATTMTLIVIGGVLYSLGVIFHVWQNLRFQNAIWHAFVVAAAAVHYMAVVTSVSAAASGL